MNYSNYRKRDFRVRKGIALSSVEAFPPQPMAWTISHRMVPPIAMAFDALIVLFAGLLGCASYHLYTVGTFGDIPRYVGLAAIAGALLITLGKSAGLYDPSELLSFKSQIHRLAIKWFGILLFLATAGFAMKIGENFSRGATILFFVFGFFGLIAIRAVWRLILADGTVVRKFAGRKVALIADQSSAIASGLLEGLRRHGLQLAHHFVLPADYKDRRKQKEIIAQAVSTIRRSHVDEIVIAADLEHWLGLNDALSELRVLPIPVNLVPVGPTSDLFHLPFHSIGQTVTIELQRGPRTLFERFVTRAVDLTIASTAIVLLLPLLIMTAIAVKLDSSGPVIFRQRRCGFNGRIFHIFKFRTMFVLEDGNQIVPAKLNDNRVTRIGSRLRRTSIDELPQLFNVLQGTMSIVGPRPHAVTHDDEFEKLVGNYAYRQHVKPGITGWAQVHGCRGETRTLADLEERVRLDLWYINNWNLALDLRIILMTIVEVMRGKNAY
jgi:Undecaprenyl-phosphate glucose phosphotransferase